MRQMAARARKPDVQVDMTMDYLNVTLTLMNHWKGGQREKWTPVRLEGCSWFGKLGASARHGGLTEDGGYTVRVPAGAMPEGYLTPGEYAALADPAGHWTVQPGDIMARGVMPSKAPDSRVEILAAWPERFVVTGVRDNRRGPALLQHLRIEGA